MVQQQFQSIESDQDPVQTLEETGYVFEYDRGYFQSFLLSRPDIVDFLKGSYGLIQNHFNCHHAPFIEYSEGYEEGDDDYLVVNMPTKLAPKNAVEKRKQFQLDWQSKFSIDFCDLVYFRIRYFE